MVLRPFDFSDIDAPHDALRRLPDDPGIRARLHARLERGSTPTCAAAVLAERGDASVRAVLGPVGGYLDPPDIAGLAALGATDELATIAAALWVPVASRLAAVHGLAGAPPTALAVTILSEIASRDKDPAAREASDPASEMHVRADKATRAMADKLRARAALVKSWTGIRRQELQREVATGEMPAPIALFANDPAFLATLVPPIHDRARAGLLSALLVNARAPDEATRAKTFQVFHPRWRDLARGPLSLISRLSAMREREATLPIHAIEALGRMGAVRELLIAAVSGVTEARAAAVGVLERVGARGLGADDVELSKAAVERLRLQGESESAERVAAVMGKG